MNKNIFKYAALSLTMLAANELKAQDSLTTRLNLFNEKRIVGKKDVVIKSDLAPWFRKLQPELAGISVVSGNVDINFQNTIQQGEEKYPTMPGWTKAISVISFDYKYDGKPKKLPEPHLSIEDITEINITSRSKTPDTDSTGFVGIDVTRTPTGGFIKYLLNGRAIISSHTNKQGITDFMRLMLDTMVEIKEKKSTFTKLTEKVAMQDFTYPTK